MNKLYVIAGNYEQFRSFKDLMVKDADALGDPSDRAIARSCTFVHNVNMLRGISDPDYIFHGTWRDRADIKDIVNVLLTSSRTRTLETLLLSEIKKSLA